jgi:hypothetical protein
MPGSSRISDHSGFKPGHFTGQKIAHRLDPTFSCSCHPLSRSKGLRLPWERDDRNANSISFARLGAVMGGQESHSLGALPNRAMRFLTSCSGLHLFGQRNYAVLAAKAEHPDPRIGQATSMLRQSLFDAILDGLMPRKPRHVVKLRLLLNLRSAGTLSMPPLARRTCSRPLLSSI